MGYPHCVFNGVGLQRVGRSGTRLETGEEAAGMEPRCAVARSGTADAVMRWGGEEKSVLEGWMVDSLYLATAQMGEIRKRAMLTSRTIRENFLFSKGSVVNWKRT